MKSSYFCPMKPPLTYRPKSTSANIGEYRYFFNGQEVDNEVYGEVANFGYEFRQYDSRLARWWSVDPKWSEYPDISPFVFCNGSPIMLMDWKGKEAWKPEITKKGDIRLNAEDRDNLNSLMEFLGRSINPLLPEKPYLEIGPSCIVYAGITCNLYDDCHRKHGKWIVYTINNFFRKDSTSFLLPFDVDVLAEQYFENGKKVGSWTGFYHGGEKCFTCVFSNDSLVKGVFFKEDGRIRYKYMHMKNGMFVFKDFTDKRKKINITQEELSVWLRLLT